MPESIKPRVLFVDDEPDLLEAMMRGLRSEHFAVATAVGGAAALEMLQHAGPFAVIVSDLNMPGMDGVTLLRLARQVVPDTVRVLFTGQPDLERSIAAINEGAIFRFITKPCSRVSLALALKSAVEQYRLMTAERVLLEQTLHGSIQALTGILALTNPMAFGRAARLRQTVRLLAAACGVTEHWAVEVAAMLSQIGCVILPPATLERVYRGEALSEGEQSMVRRMPDIVEQVISNIPRLEPVQEILRLYDNPPEACGSGQSLPWGARALKLAVDLDVLESQGVPVADACQRLRENRDTYDPEMLERLAEIRNSEQRGQLREVPVAGLLPGMVLAQDVRTREGELFAARGQEVTPSLLAKLLNFTTCAGALEETCFVSAGFGDPLAKVAPLSEAQQPAAGSSEFSKSAPGDGEAPPVSDQDPVTRCPGRSRAVEALAAVLQAEPPCYAVMLVLDDLPKIQVRFGRRVADILLRSYADFVVGILAPGDRLFRWSGAALLALLPRLDELDAIRSDFRASLDRRKFRHVVRTSTRSIPLTISPRWTVIPVHEASGQLVPKIDQFVGAMLTPEQGGLLAFPGSSPDPVRSAPSAPGQA